jgi:hypothetical protein
LDWRFCQSARPPIRTDCEGEVSSSHIEIKNINLNSRNNQNGWI